MAVLAMRDICWLTFDTLGTLWSSGTLWFRRDTNLKDFKSPLKSQQLDFTGLHFGISGVYIWYPVFITSPPPQKKELIVTWQPLSAGAPSVVDLESEIISYKETIAARGVKDCDPNMAFRGAVCWRWFLKIQLPKAKRFFFSKMLGISRVWLRFERITDLEMLKLNYFQVSGIGVCVCVSLCFFQAGGTTQSCTTTTLYTRFGLKRVLSHALQTPYEEWLRPRPSNPLEIHLQEGYQGFFWQNWEGIRRTRRKHGDVVSPKQVGWWEFVVMLVALMTNT